MTDIASMNDPLRELRARATPVMRLPAPGQPEDDMDMAERHTFSGDDLTRMAARMARALRRLGLPEGGGGQLVLAAPQHTLEWLMLWLGAVAAGQEVQVLTETGALPDNARALVCPPSEKAVWLSVAREMGAKLATLGGHWEGSLFMLQMVQPNEAEGLFDIAAGRTCFGEGDPLALEELLARAAAFASRNELAAAPALLVSVPVLQSPDMLAAALAALLTDVPLYWIAPGARREALKKLSDLPAGALVLGDAEFVSARRWERAVRVGE